MSAHSDPSPIPLLTFYVTVGVLVIYGVQAYVMSRQMRREGIIEVAAQIQRPDQREARGFLRRYTEARQKGRYLSREDKAEHQKAVDTVGHTLNTIAFLCEERALDVAQLMDNWGIVFVRAWRDCQETVNDRRDNEAVPRLWRSFERLGRIIPEPVARPGRLWDRWKLRVRYRWSVWRDTMPNAR